MTPWKKILCLTSLTALFASGCTASNAVSQPKSEQKLKIVTTFYPMYEFAKKVAGDRAEVSLLIPSNVEPHDWEPTPQDLIKMQQADLFVYNGAGMEGWVEKTLRSLKSDRLKVVEATKGIQLLEGMAEDDHEEAASSDPHADAEQDEHPLDPHVWLDPVLAQQQVQTIQQALAEIDPVHQSQYQSNSDAFKKQLQNLDMSYQDVVSTAKRKEFVTQHAAFGYLAKRYGLQQIPISGLNPDQEPSTAQVADVVKLAKERQVNVIYFESLVSPKVAETVAKEVGCQTAVLDPLEGLTDEEQAAHLDYIGVMERNLNELKKSLLK